jgi:hypothetical protein
MVTAPLLSVLVLRYEGAFPLTLFLLSAVAIALAFKFKETSQDIRREAIRI